MEKPLWILVHHHRHGASTYLIRASKQPTEEQAIGILQEAYEPEDEEYVDISGPFDPMHIHELD